MESHVSEFAWAGFAARTRATRRHKAKSRRRYVSGFVFPLLMMVVDAGLFGLRRPGYLLLLISATACLVFQLALARKRKFTSAVS